LGTFKVRLVVGSEPRESWEQLSLEYVVPWPLHLLITPKALANYNKVRNAVLNSNPKAVLWIRIRIDLAFTPY
jgi:hypothetical protein